MKRSMTILTILLIVAGFIYPPAWIGAAISGLIAIAARPEGVRADGKPRSGGLLGGIIDDISVATNTKECPYCKSRIARSATKCPNCGEWINTKESQSQGFPIQRTEYFGQMIGHIFKYLLIFAVISIGLIITFLILKYLGLIP